MKYKCAYCGLEFESDWTDEEALEELKDSFNTSPKEQHCAVVCDDCYRKYYSYTS